MIITARLVSEYFMKKKVSGFMENMRSKGKYLDIKVFNVPCSEGENAALPWREIERIFFLAEDENELVSGTFLKMVRREPLSLEEKAGIRKIISNNEFSFDRFSEALSRSCFNYVRDWDVSAYELEIPKAVKLLQMMKLTCLDMYMLSQEGMFEGLMKRWRANYIFSQKVSQGTCLISYLIGVALARGQIELLNLILTSGAYDVDTCRTIIEQLDPSLWRRGLILSLESERASMFDCYTRLERHDSSLLNEFYGNSIFGWLAQPLLKVDFMYAMRFIDETEDLIKKNYFESKNNFTALNNRIESLAPWYVFSLMLVPSGESAFFKEQVLEANIMMAAAGIACRLFRMKYGDFPESLSMLSPEFLPGIPLDPFSGRPLVYKKTGSGIKIYSVGSNMRDDNGVETWEITQLVAEKDDDWVWEEKE
jgi:hypothetical protein